MTDTKKDLRFQKTEISIRNTFFELLKTKSVPEITVAEISRNAMLGRGTFYLHYKDIYDLLNTLENEYIEEIGDIIDAYYPIPPKVNISELTEKIFTYINRNQDHLRLLFDHVSPRHFVDRLIIRQRAVYNSLPKDKTNPGYAAYDSVESSFMISGFAGVILDYWFLDSLHLSEKEIIENLNRILMTFSYAKNRLRRGKNK